MTQPIAIQAENLAKHYRLYAQPIDRLKQFIFGGKRTYFKHFTALQSVNLTLEKGKVLGVIGQNGAGKSTLLQLLAGTLHPSSGSLHINGRVAALLELGAGFNPELSGADNVRFYGMLMGLSAAEVDAKFDDIVAFSGIGAFIDQPVKTYSSGMFVRLAFSIATSVEPDILIIDEALSVGDGAFARKSFDRIMELRASGVTIIFCSHFLFQVESIANEVIWLEKGEIKLSGNPTMVVNAYQQFLDQLNHNSQTDKIETAKPFQLSDHKVPHFKSVVCLADGIKTLWPTIQSQASTLEIIITFYAPNTMPMPSLFWGIDTEANEPVSTGCSKYQQFEFHRTIDGLYTVKLVFNKIPLLRGKYWLNIILVCE
ncbi:MAG: ABC transporter ATP-binding protein [Gammaproteobacteria bacterium]|nr:ABC transporter ATP-binding protein [Gammaproteobacteria bacterium]